MYPGDGAGVLPGLRSGVPADGPDVLQNSRKVKQMKKKNYIYLRFNSLKEKKNFLRKSKRIQFF